MVIVIMKKVKCAYEWWRNNKGKVWCKNCLGETVYARRSKLWIVVGYQGCIYKKNELPKTK